MGAVTWLRIAAGLTLFLAAGHTFGAVLAPPSHGAADVALREAMRAYRIVEMGISRSYWDFYLGSGWTITVLLLAAAIVMWVSAPLARTSPHELRAIVWAPTLGFAVVFCISALYFVTAPIVVTAAITICLLVGEIRLKDAPSP